MRREIMSFAQRLIGPMLLLVSLAAYSSGCGGGPKKAASDCAPGETQLCDCPGSSTGLQACNGNGQYGTCACSNEPDLGTSPDTAAVEDAGQEDLRAVDLGCEPEGAFLGCASAEAVWLCSEDGSRSMVDCAAGEICGTARCEATFCTPGEARCDGVERQVCDEAGAVFVSMETCPASCEAGACTCSAFPEDDCPVGQNCYGSAELSCQPFNPVAGVGDSCAEHQDCNGGQACVESAPGSFQCLQRCDATLDNPCSGEEACLSVPGDPSVSVCRSVSCDYQGVSSGVCGEALRETDGTCAQPPDYEPVESSCDGRDNDCDGEVDEASCIKVRPVGPQIHVAVDQSTGHFYLAGSTSQNLAGLINAGQADAWVQRYDPAGNLLWTQLYGGAGTEIVNDLVLGPAASAILVGASRVSNAAQSEVFIAKFLPSGQLSWDTELAGPDDDRALQIAADPLTGEMFITGYTYGDLGGVVNPAPADNGFLSKFDGNGVHQWTRLNALAHPYWLGEALLLDTTNTRVYVAGSNGHIAAHGTANGDVLWHEQIATNSVLHLRGLALAAGGDVVATGFVEGDVDAEVNAGGRDIVVARYTNGGTLQWVRLLGTVVHDFGVDVAVDSTSDTIWVVGGTTGDLAGYLNPVNRGGFVAGWSGNGTLLDVDVRADAFAIDVFSCDLLQSSGSLFVSGYASDGGTGGGYGFVFQR